MNITLKQLHYFESLARHQQFGRAADACAISQPALSMQIKELETTLGLPLFERRARQVDLTPFGSEFLARARNILQSVEELSDLARAAQSKLVGKLRIGVIPTIAPYLLPQVISILSAQNAELDIHVRETMTHTLIEELSGGRIDTAIVALPVSESTLTEFELFEEPFALLRPLRDANLPTPDRASLREMRLLLLEEGHCFRDQALSFCTMPSVLGRDGLDASSLSTLVQMVAAGIGVTLVPRMAIDVETRQRELAVSWFPDPEPTRRIGMIWRKNSALSEQLLQIAEILKQGISQAE